MVLTVLEVAIATYYTMLCKNCGKPLSEVSVQYRAPDEAPSIFKECTQCPLEALRLSIECSFLDRPVGSLRKRGPRNPECASKESVVH